MFQHFPSVQRFSHSSAAMLQFLFMFQSFPTVKPWCFHFVSISSKILPQLCRDVATCFKQFQNCPKLLLWCCNFFHQFSHIPTVKVMLHFFHQFSHIPTVKVMLKLFFISSKIVPHLCRDVATFFISSKKDIPQSKWYCNFESVLMFPQLKWCCNFFHQFKKTSHSQIDIATLNQFWFSHC